MSIRTVTEDGIKAKIEGQDFYIKGTLTVCIITMRNGFKFVGTSACVDPANFNQTIGKDLAFKDAFRQIWSHEGYLLREQIGGGTVEQG